MKRTDTMKRVLLAMLVLCATCVGAMKLPSQLQSINPKAKVHAAIQAVVEKHAPADVRGSKLLEQDNTPPHLAAMHAALVKTLNKLPFTHKLTAPADKAAANDASRHLLQQEDMAMWAGVGDQCKAVLSAVGLDASRMDDDSYEPGLPAELAECEGAVDLAMCAVFDDSGDECDTSPANIQAHSGFCTASCKDKSLEFLADFGSVCGPNIADTFMSAIEAMPQGTTDEMAAKAFSMFVPLMVMGTFTQATQISTTMALACTGPSDSELCWSKDWFFDMAMATGDDDGEEDGEGDGDCPSGPTYLPTPAEACEDFASVPTTEFDDFCTSPELTDCCATNAVAAVVSGSVALMCPWWGILDNMMSVMGTWGVEEMEEMDMCNDAVAAICQDQTSITNYISGGADLIGGCCNPDKPAMCTGAAQKASKQVVNKYTPSDGAGPISAAVGLCGAALAAAFL